MTAQDTLVIAVYLLSSLVSFALMGVDKWKAKRGKYRISERTLLISCALLGALGGWLGMQAFHHKVRHAKFFVTVPLLMLLQLALFTFYFRR